MAQLTAVLVVNRNGHKGRCSNCNKPASADTKQHNCGAVIDRVAILATERITRLDLNLVAAMAMQGGKQFVGKGSIVPTGWTFYLAPRNRQNS